MVKAEVHNLTMWTAAGDTVGYGVVLTDETSLSRRPLILYNVSELISGAVP